MRVSVVVPTYNEEKNIGRCLDSLINQEEKADEIIVVDNNCIDKTVEIVKKYQGVRIIKEKKQGIAHARNAGFNNATSEILARCDADAIMPPDWIKKLKRDFKEKKEIVAVAPFFYIFDMPSVSKSKLPGKAFYAISKLILRTPSLVGPSMAIRKSAWEKVKDKVCVDDDRVHEDIDLSIHISRYGEIYQDESIIFKLSGRRIKFNPLSFFVEYPWILVRMLYSHRHLY